MGQCVAGVPVAEKVGKSLAIPLRASAWIKNGIMSQRPYRTDAFNPFR